MTKPRNGAGQQTARLTRPGWAAAQIKARIQQLGPALAADSRRQALPQQPEPALPDIEAEP